MIEIISYTPMPLTLMGKAAAACWGSKPSPKIAIKCIESGHHRVLEYPDVTVKISGYSARAIRELYTHIIGTTRLQQSTRYVDESDFAYYIPPSISNNPDAESEYHFAMNGIHNSYENLLHKFSIPKEDAANVLPLGMDTIIVLKMNARALMHLAELRLCTRAYKEIRALVLELLSVISKIDEEWKKLCEYFKVKCEVYGYCTEEHCCGKMPTKSAVLEGYTKSLKE